VDDWASGANVGKGIGKGSGAEAANETTGGGAGIAGVGASGAAVSIAGGMLGRGSGSSGSSCGGGPIMVCSPSSPFGRTMKRCLQRWQVMAPPVGGILLSSTR
jgi:hypothetical protein